MNIFDFEVLYRKYMSKINTGDVQILNCRPIGLIPYKEMLLGSSSVIPVFKKLELHVVFRLEQFGTKSALLVLGCVEVIEWLPRECTNDQG